MSRLPDLTDLEQAVSARAGKQDGNEIKFLCPAHDDTNPSAFYNIEKGVWHCKSCGTSGGYIDLAKRLDVELPKLPKPARFKTIATYDYHDQEGNVLFHVDRLENGLEKKFSQRLAGAKRAGLKGKRFDVIYNLPAVLKAIASNLWVFPIEGEKDVETLRELGFVATCNPMGAGKWHVGVIKGGKDYSKWLENGCLVLIPDNDDAGREHILKMAETLRNIQSLRVVFLPNLPEKGDITDWINMGHTAEELKELVEKAPQWTPESKQSPSEFVAEMLRSAGWEQGEKLKENKQTKREINEEIFAAKLAEIEGIGLPLIKVNEKHLKSLTDEALKVIGQANNPPALFTRGGLMVRVKQNSEVVVMNRIGLSDYLDRNAYFARVSKPTDKTEGRITPVRVPSDLAPNILELANTDDPPTPQLDTISTVPIFTKDKTLLKTEGYHAMYNTLLRIGGLRKIRADIPIREAKSLIEDEVLTDFPLKGKYSLAHVYSMFLLPFIRHIITSATPLHMIEANALGSGKGMLCNVIAHIFTGKEVPVMTLEGNNEEELAKRITALLLEGANLVLFDNVNELKGEVLAGLLTAKVWRSRKLGASQMRDLPNDTMWLATGNNINVVGDIKRRVLPIRLDAGMEKPFERTGFKHNPLIEWVIENRSLLISACLSIIQYAIDKGYYTPNLKRALGSYESYTNIMGWILECAEIEGFLEGLDELHDVSDPEADEWKAVCKLWWAVHGGLPITTNDFLKICKESDLLLNLWGGRTDLSAQKRIAIALRKSRDRVIGDFTVRLLGTNSHTNKVEFKLEQKTEKVEKNF